MSIKKNKNSTKTSNKTLIFRLIFLFLFVILTVFTFRYYSQSSPITNINTGNDPIDMTTIINNINSDNLNLSATSLNEISPRFKALTTYKIPPLSAYSISNFWTQSMALNISSQLYNQFMNETLRNSNYLFATNKGNEKIRGNNNIPSKLKYATKMFQNNRFSYTKYEYKRSLPLYKLILLHLNSSYVVDIITKLVGQKVIGVSDLFISVFYKDNFLSTHDDRGLGHYPFILFLSQNWNFAKNGGSLNFNCLTREKWKDSCFEVKMKFNEAVSFKAWPDSIPHFVKTVKVKQPRIAITGFYFTSDASGVDWHNIAEETGYGDK